MVDTLADTPSFKGVDGKEGIRSEIDFDTPSSSPIFPPFLFFFFGADDDEDMAPPPPEPLEPKRFTQDEVDTGIPSGVKFEHRRFVRYSFLDFSATIASFDRMIAVVRW